MIASFGKRLVGLLGYAVGGLAIALFPQSPAEAQAAYGSYVGIGGGLGIGENSDFALVLNGRYNILELPISIRGTAFIGDGSAFVPTVTTIPSTSTPKSMSA